MRLVETAEAAGYTPAVLTFFPHPDVVLGRAFSERHYLMPPGERAALLGSLGVELVVTHPFDDAVRTIRAADFVDLMIAHLRLAELWVGADFALGYKREGDVESSQQGAGKKDPLRSIGLVGGD
jgi:riboflavin kinase/FMN adenylyltransferase